MLNKVALWATKNSPILFSSFAIGGVVSTTVLALKAGPKAQLIIDDIHDQHLIKDENGEYLYDIPKGEVFKEVVPVYVPVIISGVLTIFCVLMANSILTKRNALIAGLYSASETALKEYQAKVSDRIGIKEDRKIREEIAGDKMRSNPGNVVLLTGKGESICYDAWSGRYFMTDIERIRQIQNAINRDIISDMWVPLNELYYALGIPPIVSGEGSGFDIDNMLDIQFSSHLNESGQPCLVMDYKVVPRRY